MSEAKVTKQLQSIKSALSFESYRNNYEANNSYSTNMGQLNSIEETMKAAIAASGPTEGQKLLMADVEDLKAMWEQKKQHREDATSKKDLMLNSDANKAEWLKQLNEEEKAHEKESKQAQENKASSKKKRAQDRKEKRNQRRGGGGDDSDSDEQGKGKGSKGRHGGMERGSSLLGQLAGTEGAAEEGSDEAEENSGAQKHAGGGKGKTGSPNQQHPGGSLNAGGVSPEVFYRNVPISLIPKELLELAAPEGEDEEANAAAARDRVLCQVQPILNTPMVEMTFTLPYTGPLPVPHRVIALNHHQQQQIHQPHYTKKPEPGSAPTSKGGGSKGGKKQGKDVQLRFSDVKLPEGPSFVVKATMWRVVLAAHLTEFKHVVSPVPDAIREYMSGEEKRDSLLYQKKGGKKGGGSKKGAEKEQEDEGEEDGEEVMVLQHTPDDLQEHLSQLMDDDEDGEQDEQDEATASKKKKSVLDELSQQLVSQYHEDEAAEEEDEALRHAKARDIPMTMTKSMPHLHSLSESTWVILMCHGGHFAGAVFINGKAVLHKAFHRYVVRKKQGGLQSKHLKGGGAGNSIGGQIRYAQELKWKSEVRDIILLWKEHIERANMILYVAPGPANRGILTDWKETPASQLSKNLGPLATNSPLSLKDPRVRGVPYTTQRPTFGEVRSIYEALSCCHVGFYRPDGKDGGAYTGHRNHNYAVDLPDEQAFYF